MFIRCLQFQQWFQQAGIGDNNPVISLDCGFKLQN